MAAKRKKKRTSKKGCWIITSVQGKMEPLAFRGVTSDLSKAEDIAEANTAYDGKRSRIINGKTGVFHS